VVKVKNVKEYFNNNSETLKTTRNTVFDLYINISKQVEYALKKYSRNTKFVWN